MDAAPGTVSLLIAEARSGNGQAFDQLYHRYWSGLVEMARRRMTGVTFGDRDAEDIAQEALFAVCDSLTRGRIPQLRNRQQWLAFLTHVVSCKVAGAIQYGTAQKRRGLRSAAGSLEQRVVAADDQSPLQQAILRDCYEFYLAALPVHLRPFAERHLAGMTNEEIARSLGCVRRTVDRKLQLLRLYWRKIAGEHSGLPDSAGNGVAAPIESAEMSQFGRQSG